MSLKLNQYDQKILVAENKDQALYIVKWGDFYKFYHINKVTQEGYETLLGLADHWSLTNKTNFVTNAYDIATKHFNFKNEDILSKYPRNKTVVLSHTQQVAINTAIMLMGNSNSDHAEQAYFHLKTIVDQL